MIDNLLAELKRSHPFLNPVNECRELKEGYSSDSKYILFAGNSPTYLLRLSKADKSERRKSDFNLMAVHHRNGVVCSKPYAFGITADGARCYSLLGFIEGESAEWILPGLSFKRQHHTGLLAGQELWKLHQLKGDESQVAWFKRRMEKYESRKRKAKELGLGFHAQDRVERFVGKNIAILERSPVRFQHDDFHVGNLIMKNGQFAGVIDFNRCDWGDPVEDFYKIPWFSEPVSRAFAIGQIEGYLSREMPANFWLRYNLFVAMNFHGSLLYEYEFWQGSECEEFGEWQEHIAKMIRGHDFKGGGPPTWFAAQG